MKIWVPEKYLTFDVTLLSRKNNLGAFLFSLTKIYPLTKILSYNEDPVLLFCKLVLASKIKEFIGLVKIIMRLNIIMVSHIIEILRWKNVK